MVSVDIEKYELILMDLDMTLVRPIHGRVFPETVDDRELMPGREGALKDLHAQGKQIAVVTNQGGRAWGIFTEEEMNAWLDEFCGQYGISHYQVCYHDTGKASQKYPEKIVPGYGGPDLTVGGFERRKPGPGMLLDAMLHFNVPKERTVMVGDRHEDEDAAKAAGVDFVPAWKFFGDPEPIEPDPSPFRGMSGF
jgi:HAD superfamily hydrolase (TIGR01662 family)